MLFSRKRKIKGGVKLFKASEGFLSCEEVKDTYTETHNIKSKKLKNKRRQIDEEESINEDGKFCHFPQIQQYVHLNVSYFKLLCYSYKIEEIEVVSK